MVRPRWNGVLIALVFMLAAAPLSFLAGVFTMAGLQYAFGPPVGGEALQGVAFTAFLFGGPIGLTVGSVLAGWLGYRMGLGASWLSVALTAIALAMASPGALIELGVW